ncbi:MAG: hypothetical protein KA198_10310, partial [Chitinophagaceae bacterium]|nr:hypothetical protein [Chitinophagaceae bacterium]
GEIDGHAATYNELEVAVTVGSYSKGKQTGSWKEFADNGFLKAEGMYVDGNKQGLWKTYDDKGKFSSNVVYEQGIEKSRTTK